MTTQAADTRQKARDRIAMLLLGVAALGALVAFFFAVVATIEAGPETRMVESWRMYGFLVFAGLFALLAVWPRHFPGVWELVILHKLALAITAATLLADAEGASTAVVADGILAAMIIAAYVLAKGFTAWERVRELNSSHIGTRLPHSSRVVQRG